MGGLLLGRGILFRGVILFRGGLLLGHVILFRGGLLLGHVLGWEQVQMWKEVQSILFTRKCSFIGFVCDTSHRYFPLNVQQ